MISLVLFVAMAFYAAAGSTVVPVSSPVFLDQLECGACSPTEYSEATTGSLTVTQESLYWFHLSVGVPANSAANLIINGLNDTIGIAKYDDHFPEDQVTIDGMQWVAAGTQLSLNNKIVAFSSNSLPQTAWIGLRLDTLVDTLVAFYVVSTQTYILPTKGSVMPYDKVIVNEGSGWNSASNQFVAPVSGNYFVSYGVATLRGCCYWQALLDLRVDAAYVFLLSIYEQAYRVNVTTARASLMVRMQAGQALYTTIDSSGNPCIYGDNNGQTYIQGFLYSPRLTPAVAWSVGCTTFAFYGPLSVVPFDYIAVNVGVPSLPWIPGSNQVVIPVSGTYLIDLTMYLGERCAPTCSNPDERVQVLLNGNIIIELQLYVAGFDNCISRSRATLLHLNIGDHLHVTVPTVGSYFYTITNFPIDAFTGFLVNLT